MLICDFLSVANAIGVVFVALVDVTCTPCSVYVLSVSIFSGLAAVAAIAENDRLIMKTDLFIDTFCFNNKIT